MAATIQLTSDPRALTGAPSLLVLGRRRRLQEEAVRSLLPEGLDRGAWKAMVDSARATDRPRTASTWLDGPTRRVIVGVLPASCSRHNSPSRAWAVPAVVRAAGQQGRVAVVAALEDPVHAFATVAAVASAWPAWSAQTGARDTELILLLLGPDGPLEDLEPLRIAAAAVRDAAAWVDMPADRLTTDELVRTALERGRALDGVHTQVIAGRKLEALGLGGLWAVGKGAATPPALVVLDHKAGDDAPHMAWVGKGVVYDAGGLSLKSRTSLSGQSADMGGAAAVLAAFLAAVRLGTPWSLSAVLCVAENTIGPQSLRPDDVVTMFSGRTVEVNNTDAEGRLMVADGLAWAARYREPARLVDVATLTGSQAAATGKLHAAVYCNDEALERLAVEAGRASGDLVHPLPYAPELYRSEFTSSFADMRNSARNRSNAASAAAAQFLAEHIPTYEGSWLHVDMAGPNRDGPRATGFGVGLLLTLAGVGAPL